MIQKWFLHNTNTKRRFWITAIVIGMLIGLGIGQMVQFQEATAEPQGDAFSELNAELDALKAKQRALQAEWQSSLLTQVVPTLADESDGVKRQFVDFLEELGSPSVPALLAMPRRSIRKGSPKVADKLGNIGEPRAKSQTQY